MILRENFLKSRGAVERQYRKGNTIFIEGEKADYYYYYYYQIVSGIVKLGRSSENSGILFKLLRRGDEVATFCMFIDKPYLEDATAVTDCTILTMSKSIFNEVTKENGEFMLKIMKRLSRDFSDQYNYNRIQNKIHAQDKVIALFDLLKYNQVDQEVFSFQIDLTREHICFLTALDPRALKDILVQLKTIGIIKIVYGEIYY
ncbi:MAG: Crp/Fnr family transcriptional regulator [Chryseobacterium sp.]|nr:Crp/Fnr family transcriptional regulator [Chryseobacterium sp.]